MIVEGEAVSIVVAGDRENVSLTVDSKGTFTGQSTCNGFLGEFATENGETVITMPRMDAGLCADDALMVMDHILGAVVGSEDTQIIVDPESRSMTWTLDATMALWTKSS